MRTCRRCGSEIIISSYSSQGERIVVELDPDGKTVHECIPKEKTLQSCLIKKIKQGGHVIFFYRNQRIVIDRTSEYYFNATTGQARFRVKKGGPFVYFSTCNIKGYWLPGDPPKDIFQLIWGSGVKIYPCMVATGQDGDAVQLKCPACNLDTVFLKFTRDDVLDCDDTPLSPFTPVICPACFDRLYNERERLMPWNEEIGAWEFDGGSRAITPCVSMLLKSASVQGVETVSINKREHRVIINGISFFTYLMPTSLETIIHHANLVMYQINGKQKTALVYRSENNWLIVSPENQKTLAR